MASSLAAAIAEVEGPEFDQRVGLVVERPIPAEVDLGVRDAFAKVTRQKLDRLARKLAWLCGADFESALDAVQEALLEVLETRVELFRVDPEDWWGLLQGTARVCLLRMRSQRRLHSIDELLEERGDSAFQDAKPCISPSDSPQPINQDFRMPQGKDGWTRELVIASLQAFRLRTGRQPRTGDCRRVNLLPSLRTIYMHFKSFSDALLAAGMVPPMTKRARRKWTPVEAAMKCRNFRWYEGRWPDEADARTRRWDLPGYSTMVRFFGGARAIDVQLGSEAILDGYDGPKSRFARPRIRAA
jgi:DNA-directed RNA polymerase specialized sigma24 family protein